MVTPDSAVVDVLIAGAGPIGLTAAIELARRGVAVRIVDPLLERPQYAKAVGVQPRTLEIFEGMGVLRRVLDAGVQMNGQIVYVNGTEVGRLDLSLPADVPFGFFCIPQYETERILDEELSLRGVHVERGVAVTGFSQDDDGVTVALSGGETVRAAYLIGADGAHSVVRKILGLTFAGAAFEEQYMLGDVEVDWSMPRGYGVRSMHQTDGVTDDLLVCIPLSGRGRYRMSMLVPDGLGTEKPELHHIQAVIDRLSPEPTVARNLRWSSVFRISHRIVDRYGAGRVFVAGDAAHIHPPTGAQGMNTGIQDAHNLAWKLALTVSGVAAPGLLDSYDAERRPVGEEVVGRTVRNAREGIGADSNDPSYVMRREAQLLIDYAASPIVSDGAGTRAPDARGLTRAAVADPIRLFSLFGARDHTLLLYTDGGQVDGFDAVAPAAVEAAHGRLDVYLVVAAGADAGATVLPVVRDADGDFAREYGATGPSVFLVRPDGYLAHVQRGSVRTEAVIDALGRTFA
ncbi:FAD-dependent monooxygenase [Mycobacterium sp. 236(2023)]|uniref:FAD-dependent monooxygenase n=1 Tax=Mycobacterium sp. 236(2023) TaxID=3038163 RepID=UPI0024153D48|nr:FAD-dependent monooxygenase [Mycobacterium sp. 236(2023)]MDG4666936.1 FAD-dependent monooxygenase [Mycobacterium sp. 236(2023)]